MTLGTVVLTTSCCEPRFLSFFRVLLIELDRRLLSCKVPLFAPVRIDPRASPPSRVGVRSVDNNSDETVTAC